MSEASLSPEELETLASFTAPKVPEHVDPQHFAKLLSLALIVQREGGPHLTEAGMECLSVVRNKG